jgi:hypothetical protein
MNLNIALGSQVSLAALFIGALAGNVAIDVANDGTF